MIRTCWFACLLSLAVSTQTAWGQPAYAPPAGSPPAPVDPAVQFRLQLEAQLRQLQHMGGPGCGTCPSGECTRPQFGPGAIDAEQLRALIESAVRDAQKVQTSAKPDCCEESTPGSDAQSSWFWNLGDCANCWQSAWQKTSCLLTQTVQSAVGAAAAGGQCGPYDDTCETECPFAPCGDAASKKDTVKLTVRTIGQLNGCVFSDRMLIRVINATDSDFELTPEEIRWLKEQGVSDEVIVYMAQRAQTCAGCDGCPFAQAVKTCVRSLGCTEAVRQMVKAIESCCASCGSACRNGTCCQERAKVIAVRWSPCPTQTCPACPTANGCGICPFAQPNADAPNCCRATAEKSGCCDHCNCKTCGKCKSVNQDPWDAFWSCYQETVSKLLGCPSLNFARQQSQANNLYDVPPPPRQSVCPYCPTIGAAGCGKCPVMGTTPPMQNGFPPIGYPCCPPSPVENCPAQHCPWLNGTLPVPGGPFAGMLPPPCPWLGCCPPQAGCMPTTGTFPGAVPPGGMPPWCPVPPGGHWPVPHPNCAMPAAAHPWAPYVIYHEVPSPEARPSLQPVAMLPADVGCHEECKIVAGNGAVRFTTSCIDARCSTITAGNRERIVLEGNVRLVCKKGGETTSIEAPRVVVNLNQGTFTVEAGTSAAPVNACPVNFQDVLKYWSSFPY